MENNIFRLSSYCITTGLDEDLDSICMIHGYTGAIDIVDKSIVDFLQANSTFRKEDIPCSASTQDALEKRGYITKRTNEEEVEYVGRFANALFKRNLLFEAGFTVVISYDCNFRCPYCFEKGIVKDNTTFSRQMADKLYEAIEKLSSGKQPKQDITLYGGEPLMKSNKESVDYLIQKGKSLGYTFSAITNGYDLDCYEEWLSPETIQFVQITIDGIRERHNQRRIHYKEEPTFDKIVDNIGLALKRGVRVSVRINTDKENVNDITKLKDIFTELHYTENKLFSMYSALLVNYSGVESENFLSQKEYVERLKEKHLEEICQDHGLSKKIQNAIESNKSIYFSSTYCGAQTKGYVLDPLGNIYPCWEVVNRKEHCLGSYKGEEITWNEATLDMWRKCTLIDDGCIKCKYALLCCGGCPAKRLEKKKCLRLDDVLHYAVNKAFSKI